MVYPCDLPANMGNNDIFRAIYAKLSDINPSTGTIESKLDVIQDQLKVVNNSIEANTQAINKQTKAIENIQIHIDTSDLSDSVQLVAAKVEDGFVKTVEAIKSIQPGPTPPVPPRPVPPCPPSPCPEPIFYPVPIGLPGPSVYYKPKKKKCECEYNHNKSEQSKVFVPENKEDWYHRPHNPYLEPWKVEYYKSLHKSVKPTPPKRVNCQY